MKKFELSIKIENKEYVDSLIVSLVRQGYAPYIGYDDSVCFTILEDELTEIKTND